MTAIEPIALTSEEWTRLTPSERSQAVEKLGDSFSDLSRRAREVEAHKSREASSFLSTRDRMRILSGIGLGLVVSANAFALWSDNRTCSLVAAIIAGIFAAFQFTASMFSSERQARLELNLWNELRSINIRYGIRWDAIPSFSDVYSVYTGKFNLLISYADILAQHASLDIEVSPSEPDVHKAAAGAGAPV